MGSLCGGDQGSPMWLSHGDPLWKERQTDRQTSEITFLQTTYWTILNHCIVKPPTFSNHILTRFVWSSLLVTAGNIPPIISSCGSRISRGAPIYYTARKRSLGQGNIFAPVCHSVHWGGVSQHDTWVRYTPLGMYPPGQVQPPSGQVPPLGRYTPPGWYPPGSSACLEIRATS